MEASYTIHGILILLLFTSVQAQKKKLNFDQVSQRRDSALLERLPSIEGWLDDTYYLSEISDRKEGTHVLYKVRAADGKALQMIDYTELNKKLPDGFEAQQADEHTSAYDAFIWSRDKDLYYFSLSENRFRRLTSSEEEENNSTFSPDGKKIAFTRDNNLYVIDLTSDLESQLTDDGSDVIYNGKASWVYYEEILGRRSNYKAFWWSPDSKMLAFLRTDENRVPQFPLAGAGGIHGELEMQRYPKAGDPVPQVRLGVVNIRDKRTVWCDVETNADHYVAWPFWTPDSRNLLFQWMNRGQDILRLYILDLQSGRIRQIYEEKQTAWVEFFEDLHILRDNRGFIIRSDKDGWYHLYHHDVDGSLIKQITKGEWPVTKIVCVDEKNGRIFFEGWQDRSTENHIFSVDLNGKNLRRLTSEAGSHEATISPSGKLILDEYSDINNPARIVLRKENGQIIREVGNRKLAQLDEYALGKVQIFTIPGEDGMALPALWILPADFDSTHRYPVIFSVYGGPGRTSVENSFPRLSYHYRAQNGIITLMVDHRGSGHFGKKGSAQMHRRLGKYEVEDLIWAVRWLRKQSFVDSTKIGITGGSYGGYVVCLALTAGADYFKYGVANYSVTDWRLYDAVYTERYMDTPEENPEGYDYGSVLTHAAKYCGRLLISHGSMDDNVHMQNTLQFIEKLEDLNRDFELMIYPNSRHGVRSTKFRHLSRESMQFWFENLLGKDLDLE